MVVGTGTNTKAELVPLWALLWFSHEKQFNIGLVLGDSKTIVDWDNMQHQILSLNLTHWMNKARCIIDLFPETTIKHIYGEYNIEVDALSKKAIVDQTTCIFYEELLKGTVVDKGIIKI